VDLSSRPPPPLLRNGHQTKTVNRAKRCTIGEARELNLPHDRNCVKNSCFAAARLQGSDFDVVLRKLISETQRVSQRINKTSMVRFHSSVIWMT
jgi:hypothetical protein